MKTIVALLLALLLCAPALCGMGEEEEHVWPCGEEDALNPDQLKAERAAAWQAYEQEMLQDPQLLEETRDQAMTFGDVTMRYSLEVVGEKPEGGYPLYIALHGGGGSDTPDINNQQWDMMQVYYRDALECGVYVAPRGVRDTWDTHFNPESYPLYDRLIRNLILTREINPNRVYLEGFSAGGDGVYAIAPRMADRFAAANMSSGHPNGVKMLNMKNLPIQLQAGEYDKAYSRNTVTAEYDGYLDDLEETYGGYAHRTLIHYNCGHNYKDYKREELPVLADPQAWLASGDRSILRIDSFPPVYMDAFTRDPLPGDVIWDLSTRADQRSVESFYQLRAPYTTTEGLIQLHCSPADNRIEVRTEGLNGDFSILLNEALVDFDRPVVFVADGAEVRLRVTPSRAVLRDTTWERGDPYYQFEAEISYAQLLAWAGK